MSKVYTYYRGRVSTRRSPSQQHHRLRSLSLPFSLSSRVLCFAQSCCLTLCVVFWLILIAAAILTAFLVQQPSASVQSFSLQCSSHAQCTAAAAASGVPAELSIAVHNPNIISASVSSNDLVFTDVSTQQLIATGSFPSTTVHAEGYTTITVSLTLPADAETVELVAALYSGHSYTVNIAGDLHFSLGALSFSSYMNADITIPAQ